MDFYIQTCRKRKQTLNAVVSFSDEFMIFMLNEQDFPPKSLKYYNLRRK